MSSVDFDAFALKVKSAYESLFPGGDPTMSIREYQPVKSLLCVLLLIGAQDKIPRFHQQPTIETKSLNGRESIINK